MARSRSLFQFSMIRLLATKNLCFLRYSIANTRTGRPSPKSMMHIAYLLCFRKIYKFPPPYFHKIYQFSPYFVQFTLFWLNLCFLRPVFWPRSIYASCFTLTGCTCMAKFFIYQGLGIRFFNSIITMESKNQLAISMVPIHSGCPWASCNL